MARGRLGMHATVLLVAALVWQAVPTDLKRQTSFRVVNPTFLYTNHVRRNTAADFSLTIQHKGGFMRNGWLINKETTPRTTPIKPKELNNISNVTKYVYKNSCIKRKYTEKNMSYVSMRNDQNDYNQNISKRNQIGNFNKYLIITKSKNLKKISVNYNTIFNNLRNYYNNTINHFDNIISNSPNIRSQRYGPNKKSKLQPNFKNNYGNIFKKRIYLSNPASYVDNHLSNKIKNGQNFNKKSESCIIGPNKIPSKKELNLRYFDKLFDLTKLVRNDKNMYSNTIYRMRRDVIRVSNSGESEKKNDLKNTSSYNKEAYGFVTASPMRKRVDELLANMIRNISHSNTNVMRREKIDAPMLNYIFDTYSTMNKHTHQNDRFRSPQFEGFTESVVADTSATAYLDCRVASLQDKLVVWVRRKPGEDALHLLTTGLQTYTADTRFSASLVAPDNWRLKIADVDPSDSGLYECQISTHPPMAQTTRLHIHAPVVRIIDGAPKPAKSTLPTTSYPETPTGVPILSQIPTKKWNTIPTFTKTSSFVAPTSTKASSGVPRATVPEVSVLADVHYEANSCLSLSCMVRHVAMEGRVVDWYHENRHLNYDMDRGGISVRTTVGSWGADSTLSVARLTRGDAGNYTCSVATATSAHTTHATVLVHVINGESLAELHQGSAAAGLSERSHPAAIINLVISIIIILCQ